MYKVEDIITFFSTKEEMPINKMQRLLYLAYAYVLAENESDTDFQIRLFEEEFNAGVYGPSIKDVHSKFDATIRQNIEDIPKSEVDVKSLGIYPEILEILEDVWESYGKYCAFDLEYIITHNDTAWQKARGNAKPWKSCKNNVEDKDIYEYYAKEIFESDDQSLIELAENSDNLWDMVHENLNRIRNTLADLRCAYNYEKPSNNILLSLCEMLSAVKKQLPKGNMKYA